jgi:hypothetical protein
MKKYFNLEKIFILFFSFIIIILLTYNFYLRKKYNQMLPKYTLSNSQLYQYSYRYSFSFLGGTFPMAVVRDIKKNQLIMLAIKKQSIVILISQQGCSPCLKTELRLLQNFYLTYKDSLDFQIMGLGYNIDRLDLLSLLRLCKVTFPIYHDEKGIFESQFEIENFPLIFLVNTLHKITFCYYPIKKDIEFSKDNLKLIKNLINIY